MTFSPVKSHLTGPVVFVLGILALLVTWLAMEPAALHHAFDQDGYSPFELATVPFYAVLIPLVWWKCPFTGSRTRRTILCLAVSCVAFMAVVKELDLHVMAMHGLFPEVVKPDGSVLVEAFDIWENKIFSLYDGITTFYHYDAFGNVTETIITGRNGGTLTKGPAGLVDVLLRHSRGDGAALRSHARLGAPHPPSPQAERRRD